MSNERSCVHVYIEGYVQGVGFRYFVLAQADQLHLTGWVRNTYNDEVEVWAEGSHDDLERLLEQLRQGPASAMVTGLRFNWTEPSSKYSGFRIAPTY